MTKRNLVSSHVLRSFQIREKSSRVISNVQFDDRSRPPSTQRQTSTYAASTPHSVVQQHANLRGQWLENQSAMRTFIETLARTTQLAPAVVQQKKASNDIQAEGRDPLLNIFTGLETLQKETTSQKLKTVLRQADPKIQRASSSAEQKLIQLLKARHGRAATNVYNKLTDEEFQVLSPTTLRQLFNLFTHENNPVEAFNVLEHFAKRTNSENSDKVISSMIAHLCKTNLRRLDPERHDFWKISELSRNVMRAIGRLDRKGQERCLPLFTVAMVEQRIVKLGPLAMQAYRYMEAHDFELHGAFLTRLLTSSRFFRQDDLPFAEIMHRISKTRFTPQPEIIINALANFFPFTNLDEVRMALDALVELQSRGDPDKNFCLDSTTMAVIGNAAAAQGASDIGLLLLDLAGRSNVAPSEGLLESVVVSLALEAPGSMWAALVDMEKEFGFTPSRPLLRSLSIAIRDDPATIQRALDSLDALVTTGEVQVTTACLNVLLSALAERGDPFDRVYRMFEEYGIEPSIDTYGFAMEALGKHLTRQARHHNADLVTHAIDKANAILDIMEERDIPLTRHIVKDYLELLCLADDLDTASACVLGLIDNRGLVDTKTLYRVAIANAQAGRIQEARELASAYPVNLPFLDQKIQNIEGRMNDI